MAARVLIVEDSAYHRRTLARIVAADPSFDVAGTAADGEDAIRKVVTLKPDLVTCDLEMPRMDGFTFLRWLMRTHPRPVLVISSREDHGSIFRALDIGAADFVVKPVSHASTELNRIEGEVLTKLRQIAAARPEKLAARAEAVVPAAPQPPKAVSAPVARGRYHCIAIGASTGGPPALQRLMAALPPDLPVGVLIVQHMPEGFTGLFAERLDRLSSFRVREAKGGEEVTPGLALIAPGGGHLVVRRGPKATVTAAVEPSTPADRYVPSVDRLLLSAAEAYGSRLLGVILTGMGDDGVAGIRAVKHGGGATFAESEETCVVFGMPREAIRAGAVDRVLPLQQIGGALVKACLPQGAERRDVLPEERKKGMIAPGNRGGDA